MSGKLIVLVVLLLTGCASDGGSRPAASSPFNCPPDRVVVCHGGVSTKIPNSRLYDPKYCGCECKGTNN